MSAGDRLDSFHLGDAPKGQQAGRPSKSLTLEQAVALMAAAKGTSLEAYVVLSLLSGVRTEEARALCWDHVVAWVAGITRPLRLSWFIGIRSCPR